MNILQKTTIKLIAIIFCTTLFTTSCEQEDWMDWNVTNQQWLNLNANEDGITTTHTGLQYKIVNTPHPNGTRPSINSLVNVTYTGKLIDGTVFDSGTIDIQLYNTILGWQEGICKMRQYEKAILYIPYDLGYGKAGSGIEGSGSFIPPYSTLIFEVTLNKVN